MNEIGLTPLGEPLPKFFICVDLVFFMGSKYGGRGGGCWRFFSVSVYGVALNQTYTELILN